MKNRRYLLTLAVLVGGAFLALSLLFGQIGTAQERRTVEEVAVCDILEVFRNYDRASDLTEEFEQRRDAIAQEVNTRMAQVEAWRNDLGAYRPGSDEHEQLMQNIERKSIETQAWQEYQMVLAGRDHHRLTTEMYNDILAMVKIIADERGHKIVLFRESPDTQTENIQQLLGQIEGRKVLYASSSVDLTNIVLDRLNSRYNS